MPSTTISAGQNRATNPEDKKILIGRQNRMRFIPLLSLILLLATPAVAQFEQAPLRVLPGQSSPNMDRRPMLPQTGTIRLSAVFAENGIAITSGLIWRVFEDRSDGSGPALIERKDDANPSFQLPPGNYIIHASYGYSSATRRVTMQWSNLVEELRISAGGLKLNGVVGESPIPPSELTFSVYVPLGNDPEGRLVVANARADEVVRLPEGTYHVVSTYGDANAIMRADLDVETGQVTEATLNHRAATVTLKLVASAGGEAFAGTAFSVLTPGGDVVREAIGAFPQVTLAEGEYVVIARQDGRVFTHEFIIESGLNRDIEVKATD
jgi:hypothetical protein